MLNADYSVKTFSARLSDLHPNVFIHDVNSGHLKFGPLAQSALVT